MKGALRQNSAGNDFTSHHRFGEEEATVGLYHRGNTGQQVDGYFSSIPRPGKLSGIDMNGDALAGTSRCVAHETVLLAQVVRFTIEAEGPIR